MRKLLAELIAEDMDMALSISLGDLILVAQLNSRGDALPPIHVVDSCGERGSSDIAYLVPRT